MGKNRQALKKALCWIHLGILVIGYTGCKPAHRDQGKVVLVLEDSVVYDFLSQKKASLHFLEKNSLPEKTEFRPDTAFTQLSVDVERDWLELIYKESTQAVYSYIFQKGNSVLFKISEGKPWMQVLNRTTKKYDINWEAIRNRNLIKRQHTSLEDFYFLWNSTFNSLIPVNMKSELQLAKSAAAAELNRERFWLDSLVNNGLLTNSYSELFAERNRFESSKIGFFVIEDGAFDALVATQNFLSDSSFEKHHIFLDDYVDFLLGQLIVQHSETLGQIIGGTSDGYFSKLMLYKRLKRQVHELSFVEIDQLLTINMSNLPAEWLKKLRAPFGKLLSQDPDMELQAIGEKRLGFDEVLDQKNGMYVYVDLWAAWCIPCIRSFPDSRLLQEEYEDKGMEVVYLSVDKNHKFWEEVIRKYEIAFPDRSYVVMNIDKSAYLKEINVELIPRYLLFGPRGKLIHQNAPRPESKEIRDLLDSLISKSG